MRLLAVWIINAAALFLVGYLISGVHLGSFGSAMIAALVLGLVNALIRPILVILTLPVTLLTLGLFIFVINAAMLMLTSWLAGQLGVAFHIDRFWPTAVVGATTVSVVSWILGLIIDPDDERSDYRV